MSKTLTIRITDEQADEAELTARIQDSSVSALIRNAIDLYLKTCRNDPTSSNADPAPRSSSNRK
jgi:predicted transcriptional regulator